MTDSSSFGIETVLERHPYRMGAVLAFVTILIFVGLPDSLLPECAAILLASIAGAYWGFAATDGRGSAKLIEGIVGLLFCGLAFLGLLMSPIAIVVGYLGHGFWDLVHHRYGPHADIPWWWIPVCVVYDWLVGIFLLVKWW